MRLSLQNIIHGYSKHLMLPIHSLIKEKRNHMSIIMIMTNIMEYLVRKYISNQSQTTLQKLIEVIWKLESDLYSMNDFGVILLV